MNSDSRGPHFCTYTGKRFHFLSPTLEEIDIVDIAHGLSMECRYGNQCKIFYSVAEHCLHVATAVQRNGGSPMDVFWGLMHDAAEAYIGDMVGPLKHALPDLMNVEAGIMIKVCERFGMPMQEPALVKSVDRRAWVTECTNGVHHPIRGGVIGLDFPPPLKPEECFGDDGIPQHLSPERAKEEFMIMFAKLRVMEAFDRDTERLARALAKRSKR